MNHESAELEEGADDGALANGGEPVRKDALTAIVEIEDGLAVVLGSPMPDGLDIEPFTLMDSATRNDLAFAAAAAVGLGNVVAQGINGALQAQGLVRLAPQTMQALKTATPIVKDGWNLGTLASGGKMTAQVRWLPATGATSASVLASMGPAIALVAIQFQLNQLSAAVEHNLELTSTVLQVVRRDQWSSVAGHYNTLKRELRNAQQIGEVTDAVFAEVQGYQGEIASQWDSFEKAVQQHVEALRSKDGHKETQQYLTDNGQAIIADVQALLLAQTSWFLYHALRAGKLSRSARSDPQDAELLKTLVADVQALHEETLNSTDWLLDQLAREFAILDELPGKRTFKIGGSARAAKDVASIAHQLQNALIVARGLEPTSTLTTLPIPPLTVFENQPPEDLLRILPLRLERGERVLALGEATNGRWSLPRLGSGWIAVTDRRVLLTKQDSLRRQGVIDTDIAVEDIRYVRRPDAADKALTVDVITKDTDVTLQFPAWTKNGAPRLRAQRMADLLASLMRLPEDEVPVVRLGEVGSV